MSCDDCKCEEEIIVQECTGEEECCQFINIAGHQVIIVPKGKTVTCVEFDDEMCEVQLNCSDVHWAEIILAANKEGLTGSQFVCKLLREMINEKEEE